MSDHLCFECKTQPPAFICFCEEVMVCKTCISKHLLDNPNAEHKPKSVDSIELDQLIKSVKKGKEAGKVSTEDTAEQKRKNQKAVLERDLENLHLFQSQSLFNLQQVRHGWTHEVERVIDDLSHALSERAQVLADAIKQKIADLEDPASPPADMSLSGRDSLLNLHLQVKEVDLPTILHKAIDVRVDFDRGNLQGCLLYKFFGGTNIIGMFDPRTETMGKHISAGQKFYHNSCSCLTPNGNVLITGGSLTGRSRSDCILFMPLTSTTRDVQPMQVARRSHASIHQHSFSYVFGGLVDQERTSLCERYCESTDKWEPIGQMKERRAYHGCCELSSKLYIGGGSSNSSCEIFDPQTVSFTLVTISHIAVEDFCSLLPSGDDILIFHGNFRGEVSRWTPSTSTISRVGEMCYGNSWSSCSPLLHESVVYMLRSDSVFRYSLETGENAYVLRMTKATKKRLASEDSG